MARVNRQLRLLNAYWAIELAKATGIDRLIRGLVGAQPLRVAIPESDIRWLAEAVASEVACTEALLRRSLPDWHSAATAERGLAPISELNKRKRSAREPS